MGEFGSISQPARGHAGLAAVALFARRRRRRRHLPAPLFYDPQYRTGRSATTKPTTYHLSLDPGVERHLLLLLLLLVYLLELLLGGRGASLLAGCACEHGELVRHSRERILPKRAAPRRLRRPLGATSLACADATAGAAHLEARRARHSSRRLSLGAAIRLLRRAAARRSCCCCCSGWASSSGGATAAACTWTPCASRRNR